MSPFLCGEPLVAYTFTACEYPIAALPLYVGPRDAIRQHAASMQDLGCLHSVLLSREL